MSNKRVFMSVTATAVIASALALPGASDATELTNKTSETPWTVSLKHDLKVKEIDAKEVVKKRALDSEVAEDRASEKSESVGKDGSHEVVSGDTLSEIAHKYGVTTEDLMAWNNLNNTLILPGQELALNGDAGEDSDSEGVAEELVIVEVNEEAEQAAVAEAEAAEKEAREAEEAERVAEAEAESAAIAEAQEQAEREEAERAAEEVAEREAEEVAVAEAETAEQAEREAEEARIAEEEAAAEEQAAAEEAERAEAEAEEAEVEEAPEVQQASNKTNYEATVQTVSAEANNVDEQAEREAAEAEAAEKKAEEERVAAEKQKEEERKAAEAAEQKKEEEADRKAAAEKTEQDRIAAEKKEEERKAAEAAQKKKEEEERKAAEAEQNNVGGGDLISNAKSVIDTPYVWGGSQPGGFDCSGFIQWAHNQSGSNIPRLSVEGYYNKSYIVNNPQPGDLVFFEGTYKSGMSHMGIYLGNGQMIHAGSSTGVAIANVNGPYWGDHFHSYKRFY